MAKKCYVGVDGVARKVKKGYLGIDTDFPIYSEETKTVDITADNIAEYFEVTNGSYYFVGSGSTFTTNNGGVNSSTASTVLKAKQDVSALSFSYSYSSEANYDKFTLTVGGTTVESAVSGSTTSKTYSGSLAKDKTIEFTYTKDSSQHKNDDQCTFSAMSITYTSRTQIDVETKPIARQIKRAYIGIGGVARPCWSGGELAYYGAGPGMSSVRYNHAAATIKNYGLFAGGSTNSGTSKTVDTINKSLTRGSATSMSLSRSSFAGTQLDNYAVFAGGTLSSSAYIEAYDASLTHTTPSKLGVQRTNLTSSPVGGFALFAGGAQYSDGTGAVSNVDAFDNSLTKVSCSGLSETAYGLSSATIKNKVAIFLGGFGTDYYPYICTAFSAELTRMSKGDVTRRSEVGAASVGNYAIFVGGDYYSSSVYTVEAFNESLTKTICTDIESTIEKIGATTIDDFAVFLGNKGAISYDASLTKRILWTWSGDNQRIQRYPKATPVGNYAIFAGGLNNSNSTTSMTTVYTVA